MKAEYKKAALLFIAAGLGRLIFMLGARSDAPEYIYLMSGIRSYEDFAMFQSFENAIKDAGGVPIILDFEKGEQSSISQSRLLRENVTEQTVCIIVNGASNASLAEPLQEYQEKGIVVMSSQGEIAPEYRALHVGVVDPAVTAAAFMEETVRICGGKGMFVIVSESPHNVFCSDIIMNLRHLFEKREYPEMMLSDILFGYHEEETSQEMIRSYLEECPDTKVLICLSESMTLSACKALNGWEGKKPVILGFGNSGHLEETASEEKIPLKILEYDMEQYGALIGELAEKMVKGEYSGTVGEKIELSGKLYEVQGGAGSAESENADSDLWLFEDYERWTSGYVEE